MEDLLATIEKTSLDLPDDLTNKRKSQFKCNGRTEESARDRRREQLLEDYKKKRDLLVNEKRGLIEEEFSDNEDWMDWETTSCETSQKGFNANCRGQLMLSEWLLDRPCDIETNWTVVLCPEGRRTLIIATKGCTRAYHKNGRLIAKFRSILPSGSPDYRGKRSDIVILDCIWQAKTRQLFALDVLFWKIQPLLGCDAQFRMYWLQSKISELKKYDLPQTLKRGVYDVHLPPHCSLSTLPAVLADHDTSEIQLDGILFYHNSAPYISGRTPLVGWLKPYMLQERFGLEVPQRFLDQRPDDYQNLEQWVEKVSHSHKKLNQNKGTYRYRRNNRNKMELDSTSGSQSEVSETSVCEMGEVEEKSVCEMGEVEEKSVCEMGEVEEKSDTAKDEKDN